MNLYEYQAKSLMSRQGISIPKGRLATNDVEIKAAGQDVGFPCVVKAQVHAGGRGKLGAVVLVQDDSSLNSEGQRILDMTVKGFPVSTLLIEEGISIDKEFYFGVILDRSIRDNVVIACSEGGVDIEKVAEETPEKIKKIPLNGRQALSDVEVEETACFLGLELVLDSFRDFVSKLFLLYFNTDSQLLEVNPLVLTSDSDLLACDGKMTIDANALYRHEDLLRFREESDSHPLEVEAHEQGIAYVKLDGYVGCLGNGAGLVMTTMDEVKRYGGVPADFLDIGGGASEENVKKCLSILLKDDQIKGLFINIFGGITRCDEVARALVALKGDIPADWPVVVRFSGTRAKEGSEVLSGDSRFIVAIKMSEGAEKIVQAIESKKG